MEDLVNSALVGTARRPPTTSTRTVIDVVSDGLTDCSPERALLLRAGALAIAMRAGYVPDTIGKHAAAAEPETLMECSNGLAEMLRSLPVGRGVMVHAEALERMRTAGLHLTHASLPSMLTLATNHDELRSALAPVIGTRGRWLAGQNPVWAWVRDALIELGDELPPDAEALWQEGTPQQRLAVLRRVRATDPTQTRQWIANEWRNEKGEARLAWIELLGMNPHPDDEPLLETALDDRSTQVRQAAIGALVKLPGSEFMARARGRAEDLLSINSGRGSIAAHLPTHFDAAWERDGILRKPPAGRSERSWWFVQLLALVSVDHWERRFGLAAVDMITAAAAGDEVAEILESWARASLRSDDDEWLPCLWDWWFSAQAEKHRPERLAAAVRSALIKDLPPAHALRLAWRMIDPDGQGELPEGISWGEVESMLPRFWPLDFAVTYLRGLRAFIAEGLVAETHATRPWLQSLAFAAVSLPAEVLASALDSPELPAARPWQVNQFLQQYDAFLETVRWRLRLREELP
jgi:hypothetical protein